MITLRNFGSNRRNFGSNRSRSLRRSSLVVGGVLLLFLVFGGAIGGCYAWSEYTKETITITVDSKERVSNRDGDGSRYMLWATKTNPDGSTSEEVFEVTDTLMQGKFRAADTYGKLKTGKTYIVEVNGWRNGFFSSNRNILTVLQEVEK